MQQTSNKSKKPFNWKVLVGVLVAVLIVVAIYIGALAAKQWDFKAGTLFFIKDIMLNNFLGINAILIGLLVFIGYLILGRGFSGTIIGTMKAIIGVLLLQIGSGALVGLAKPIFAAFQKFSGTSVIPLDTYSGQVSVGKFLDAIGSGFSSWVSYALIIGLFVNIILIALRKWTNVHSLMITGHVMFQQARSCCTSYICINVFKRRWTNWWKRCSIIRCAIRNNNIFWITIRCLLRCCFISLQSKELMQLHKMLVLQLATNKCLVLCNSIQNWKVLW